MDDIHNPAFFFGLDMITQSLSDLYHTRRTYETEEEAAEIREDALRWFNDRDTSVCGYGWCLVQTGANPNLVREKIDKNLAKFTHEQAKRDLHHKRARAVHNRSIKDLMKEFGCNFRNWNPKAFWPVAGKQGHTSVGYDSCKCKTTRAVPKKKRKSK